MPLLGPEPALGIPKCQAREAIRSWTKHKHFNTWKIGPGCCCEALARQRYNIFGKQFLEPKDIRTATFRDLCLFIRDTGILNLY
jgi:hypothetical protein